jgi:hypothetical protein
MLTLAPKIRDGQKKSFHDYTDRYWAFAREIMQNSLDCGSTRIDINVSENEHKDETDVEVTNNGEPMTEEVLAGKLLSLGSSGKDFQNSVGGFGKAKEILYFAHKEYTIVSGDWSVRGSGAMFDLGRHRPHTPGTTSVVTWNGLFRGTLRDQFKRFIELCGARDCTFTLDGERIRPKLPASTSLRDLEHEGTVWAKLSAGKFAENLLVVRMGGMPMFVERCDYKHTLVLELQGTGAERLTSNRDGLRYPFSGQLRDFITTLAVDKRTALKVETPVYTRYGGTKLQRPNDDGTPTSGIGAQVVPVVTAARASEPAPMGGAGILVQPLGRAEAPAGVLGHEFIVKNCLRLRVPYQFDPDDIHFSDHAHGLVKAWAGCLLELHALHEVDDVFSVGFVFSEDVEAEFESSPEYGKVYYLNPCRVLKRRFKRRFRQSERGRIAAIAAHEFVHGGMQQSYHGEEYANRLTNVMSVVCDHWRRFARHFR